MHCRHVVIMLVVVIGLAMVMYWYNGRRPPRESKKAMEMTVTHVVIGGKPPEPAVVVVEFDPATKKKTYPPMDEFLERYRQLENEELTSDHIHEFVTTYRAAKHEWNVTERDMEPTIREMVKDWNFWSKLRLKSVIDDYKRSHRSQHRTPAVVEPLPSS